jgi:NACHT domain-containing protein
MAAIMDISWPAAGTSMAFAHQRTRPTPPLPFWAFGPVGAVSVSRPSGLLEASSAPPSAAPGTTVAPPSSSLPLPLQWLGSGLVGVILAVVVAGLWRRLRERHRASSALKNYLAAICGQPHASDTAHAFADLRARYDLNAYVTPWLRFSSGERRTARTYLVESTQQPAASYLLVHGVFGSGKTALAMDLTVTLAQRALANLRPGATLVIPLYVPAGARHLALAEDFAAGIDRLLTEYGLGPWGGFRGLRKSHRVALILDGFDQMFPRAWGQASASVVGHIHRLLQTSDSRNAPWLMVTARSDFIDDRDSLLSRSFDGSVVAEMGDPALSVPPFDRLLLEGLDDTQLLDYLGRRSDIGAASPEFVLERLRANVHLSEWMRHPLILNMFLTIGIDAITQESRLNVADLYRRYSDHWFRSDSRLVRLGSWTRREQFAEDLALSVLLDTGEAVSVEDIRGIDGTANWISSKEVLLDRQATYWDTSSRSVLHVNRDDTVSFIHRSFVEYFASECALRVLRSERAIPDGALQQLYSSLIVSFMRFSVTEADYAWVLQLARDREVYRRCLGNALLPAVVGSKIDETVQLLRASFERETDIDAQRHMLYGIGWLGADPCDETAAEVLRQHRTEWLEGGLRYYHTVEQQRMHCVHRLRSFAAGDDTFVMNRGLYIFDLSEVGEAEDIPLIAPYALADIEANRVVRAFADDAVQRITTRTGGRNDE